MRRYPRPGRTEIRLGNQLADVSGEILTRPTQLAAGTGAYHMIEISVEPTEHYEDGHCHAPPSSPAHRGAASRRLA